MDIFKKYKKHKKISNISIVTISLVVAIWVNFFVLNQTDFSKNLKTSVIESNQKKNLSDLYLENNNWKILLKTSKQLNNIKNLSLSFVYNPENIELENLKAIWNSEVENISNTDWISTIFINFQDKKTIKNWENILEINPIKKEQKSEQINLINSNFTDNSWENFLLTTSWITF